MEISVRLAHPLYGEIVRDLASPLYKKQLAGTLLRSAAWTDQPGDTLRRALWHLEGGVLPDPDLLRDGAVRALAALDLPLAVRFARAAIDSGGGPECGGILARAHMLRGNTAEAEELLAELASDELPDLVRADLAASRAWNLTFGLGRPVDAQSILDEAWDVIPTGREIIAAQRANLYTYAGLPVQALAAAQLHSVPGNEPTTATVRMLTAQCESLGVQGRCIEAVQAGRQAVALNTRLGGREWSMSQDEAEAALTGALIVCGRLDEAAEFSVNGYDRSVAAGWLAGAGMWSVWLGEISLARGRPATAAGYFQAALTAAGGDTHPYRQWLTRLALEDLARAAALCGDVALAASSLVKAQQHMRPWLGALDVWGGSSGAWLAVVQGETKRGIDIALAAAERARRDQQFGWELLALHQVVRFGDFARAIRRMDELAQKVDGPLAPLYVGHGTALASGDGLALDRVAEGFRGLGFLLLAAEAAAHAAWVHERAGSRKAAAASAGLAHCWASECEGACSPALLLLTGPPALTNRETEISRLAASGLTNRQIAAKLVISVRTVDNILHHVYEKLGLAAGRICLRSSPAVPTSLRPTPRNLGPLRSRSATVEI